MKSLFLIFAFVAASAGTSMAQGKITFYNRGYLLVNGDAASALDANSGGIFRSGGAGAGAGFTAGLFLASNLETPIATTLFRTTSLQSVFAQSQEVSVPGIEPGQTAQLVIRAWETASGSYASANQAGLALGRSVTGEQAFTSLPLGGTNPAGGADIPIPGLTGFTGFIGVDLIPEPSTDALIFGGVCFAILASRRRKSSQKSFAKS